MTAQYLPVLMITLGALGFMAVMLGINALLGPKRKAADMPAIMLEPFECGSPPLQTDNRRRTAVKFYLVAVLFVMFDLEVVFMYPWAVNFKELGWYGFWAMSIFLVILTAGLLYEWKKGALEWE